MKKNRAAGRGRQARRAFRPTRPTRGPNRVPTYNFARAEYKRLIERLLLQAGITDGKPGLDRSRSSASRSLPKWPPRNRPTTTLIFQIEINKADLWQIVDFLYGYYQLDLLHQITDIKITRENTRERRRAAG